MINELSAQIEQICRFCYPPEKERILLETDNFYVMLSLGPIVEGYTLLVSKQHFSCCGAIPEYLGQEFDSLYFKIKDILVSTYGNVVCYEHGQAGSCLSLPGSKHCFHAHMHFVPAQVALQPAIEKDFVAITTNDPKELRSIYGESKSPYLYVEDQQGSMVYLVDKVIEKQYLRKIVATELNDHEAWDWVAKQNWDTIRSGIANLTAHFQIDQVDAEQ